MGATYNSSCDETRVSALPPLALQTTQVHNFDTRLGQLPRQKGVVSLDLGQRRFHPLIPRPSLRFNLVLLACLNIRFAMAPGVAMLVCWSSFCQKSVISGLFEGTNDEDVDPTSGMPEGREPGRAPGS